MPDVETLAGNQEPRKPRNLGLWSCAMFCLALLARVSAQLIFTFWWGPDRTYYTPESPLRDLAAVLLLAMLPLIFAGMVVGAFGLWQRKPWAALLGLALNGAAVWCLFAGLPVARLGAFR
jgi:hypothetical protein